MPHLVQDVVIYQGSAPTIELTIYTSDAKTTVKDLTGFTKFDMRIGALLPEPEDTTLVVSGAIEGAPTLGRVNFLPTAVQTAALAAAVHDMQIWATDSGARVEPVTSGLMTVKAALPVAA